MSKGTECSHCPCCDLWLPAPENFWVDSTKALYSTRSADASWDG
jgi:hypothetical protein